MRFPVYVRVNGSAAHDTLWREAGAWVLDIQQGINDYGAPSTVRVELMRAGELSCRECVEQPSPFNTVVVYAWDSLGAQLGTPKMDVLTAARQQAYLRRSNPPTEARAHEDATLRAFIDRCERAVRWRAKAAQQRRARDMTHAQAALVASCPAPSFTPYPNPNPEQAAPDSHQRLTSAFMDALPTPRGIPNKTPYKPTWGPARGELLSERANRPRGAFSDHTLWSCACPRCQVT